MILVDSSVWIDYFNGTDSDAAEYLDQNLSSEIICIGDIVLAEVLQGFRSDTDYKAAKSILSEFPVYQMMTPELAITSADNYRKLRRRGITVRKSVDVWIATFCIENDVALLFSDRDFIPFVKNLKLATPLKYT